MTTATRGPNATPRRDPYPRPTYEGVPKWWIEERMENVGAKLDDLPEGERFLARERDRLLTLDEAAALFRHAFRYSRRYFRKLHKPLLKKYAHGEDGEGRLCNQLYYESQVVAAIHHAKREAQPVGGPGAGGDEKPAQRVAGHQALHAPR